MAGLTLGIEFSGFLDSSSGIWLTFLETNSAGVVTATNGAGISKSNNPKRFGADVGMEALGDLVGRACGCKVGTLVGSLVGLWVAAQLGTLVGREVGRT
jgi:hypothetical protein